MSIAASISLAEKNPALSQPLITLDSSREDIHSYFDNTWNITELLYSGLRSDDTFYMRPYHKLRHPMVFYYGHTAAVYVNKLLVAGLIDKPVNPEFERLFETGVDEMRWDDMHDDTQNVWPEIAEVSAYRQKVYDLVSNIIKTNPLLDADKGPITADHPMWALFMSFEHERIHIETSSVLMRELPVDILETPKGWASLAPLKATESTPKPGKDCPSNNRMIRFDKTTVTLGKPKTVQTFGWDNEYGEEQRNVRPFSASEHLITNAEFFEFVKDGGYRSEDYWSKSGWQWRRFHNVKWPTFWKQDGPAGSFLFKLRTLFEVVDMQWDWPAIVNYYEAKAYCDWRNKKEKNDTPYRLLTEAEHHALRDDNIEDMADYNLDLRYGSETAVDHFAPNQKGISDSLGSVWQWCEDQFHPLAGSTPHPYYDDFSTPCYDGEHQMILGGSFISTGDEASVWARFHFRPHFFQHAGFRIARNEDGNPDCDAVNLHQENGHASYETKEAVNRYLLRYWGNDDDIWPTDYKGKFAKPEVGDFADKCVNLVLKYATSHDSLLDIGCAAGRTSFDLAKHFEKVVGIDYSQALVDAANKLREQGELDYVSKDTGSKIVKRKAIIDPAIDRSRLIFEQGDGSNIDAKYKNFDAVLYANVLCRLPNPRAGLERLQGNNGLVKPGGIVVITTPFSWLEQYTPRSRWLSNGIDDVARILHEFELIHTEDVPMLFREHSRKFEYIVPLASIWRRKII